VGAVEREHPAQIDVAEVVGVDDDYLVGALGQVGVGGDRAGRAEQLGLIRLGQVEASFGVDAIDVGPHLVRVRVRVDPRLPDAGVAEPPDPVVEERAPGDRHEALGDRVRQGAQPGPEARRQDHRSGLDGHRCLPRLTKGRDAESRPDEVFQREGSDSLPVDTG
jgi:hypothetical protein